MHHLRPVLVAIAFLGCNDILGVEDRNLTPGSGGAANGGGGGGGGGAPTVCPLMECESGCVDPFSSEEHCGYCDHACDAGTRCLGGICDRALRAAPGSYTRCARTSDELACWGANNYGQRGDGSFELDDDLPPTSVVALPDTTPLYAVSAIRSTCALVADGRVFCFGDNRTGALGIGSRIGGPDDGESADCCHYVTAVEPLLPPGIEIVDVAGGGWWERNEFYCVLAANGDVYCWGYGTDFPIKKLEHAVQIEATISSACALLDDGTVWCWSPPPGPAGPNKVADGTPVQVELPAIRAIGTAQWASFAVAQDGEVWAWGLSDYGQLGPGSTITTGVSYYPPRPFGFSFDSPVVQITGNYGTACALLESGDVYCWGTNGTQGDGSAVDGGYDPMPKKALTGEIQEISASNLELEARHANGQILVWSGEQPTPTPVPLP